eukprot:Blabericola_migrator_1__7569@NODE_3869_length_1459_cov_10_016523_g2395_i0_p1_GENE_NODE_3869_length_1459_cov_10_016523_g2395_i0NODE_3869_length_1459_cov_10_016523_g2395_i0_p1_ORF_typecomplete_len452_score0_75NADH_u_ox_C/PF12853_7/0_054_NODE_3869_length_1459_cov_10_016523_g2395_i0431356
MGEALLAELPRLQIFNRREGGCTCFSMHRFLSIFELALKTIPDSGWRRAYSERMHLFAGLDWCRAARIEACRRERGVRENEGLRLQETYVRPFVRWMNEHFMAREQEAFTQRSFCKRLYADLYQLDHLLYEASHPLGLAALCSAITAVKGSQKIGFSPWTALVGHVYHALSCEQYYFSASEEQVVVPGLSTHTADWFGWFCGYVSHAALLLALQREVPDWLENYPHLYWRLTAACETLCTLPILSIFDVYDVYREVERDSNQVFRTMYCLDSREILEQMVKNLSCPLEAMWAPFPELCSAYRRCRLARYIEWIQERVQLSNHLQGGDLISKCKALRRTVATIGLCCSKLFDSCWNTKETLLFQLRLLNQASVACNALRDYEHGVMYGELLGKIEDEIQRTLRALTIQLAPRWMEELEVRYIAFLDIQRICLWWLYEG